MLRIKKGFLERLGFRFQGWGFQDFLFQGFPKPISKEVAGLGFRVKGSGFGVWSSGFGVRGLGFTVSTDIQSIKGCPKLQAAAQRLPSSTLQ